MDIIIKTTAQAKLNASDMRAILILHFKTLGYDFKVSDFPEGQEIICQLEKEPTDILNAVRSPFDNHKFSESILNCLIYRLNNESVQQNIKKIADDTFAKLSSEDQKILIMYYQLDQNKKILSYTKMKDMMRIYTLVMSDSEMTAKVTAARTRYLNDIKEAYYNQPALHLTGSEREKFLEADVEKEIHIPVRITSIVYAIKRSTQLTLSGIKIKELVGVDIKDMKSRNIGDKSIREFLLFFSLYDLTVKQ